MTDAWFDEIDLGQPWRRMGTRTLGGEGWLVVDADRDTELALKRRLMTERLDDVVAAVSPDVAPPAADLVAMIEAEVTALGVDVDAVPPVSVADPSERLLARAGLMVQEDVCLLRRRPSVGDPGGQLRWHLDGASLCFPSRWRLADKIGRPLTDVHQPVAGYDTHLARRVDGLFDSLAEPRRRRNWFVHPDGSLFQPSIPVGGDPVVPAAEVMTGLWLRSERQTLLRIGDGWPDWIVFTIRVQHAPLGRFLADGGRRDAFARWVADADAEEVTHHGIAPDQRAELLVALDT